ncbi:unnamed protein product, partial [Pylaiella littoralis]
TPPQQQRQEWQQQQWQHQHQHQYQYQHQHKKYLAVQQGAGAGALHVRPQRRHVGAAYYPNVPPSFPPRQPSPKTSLVLATPGAAIFAGAYNPALHGSVIGAG